MQLQGKGYFIPMMNTTTILQEDETYLSYGCLILKEGKMLLYGHVSDYWKRAE